MGTTTTTTPVTITNWPLDRVEILFVIAVIIFILSIPMWERLLTVTTRSYDV